MTASADRSQVDAFVDGELDLASQLAIEQRLQDDPALQRQIDDARALRAAVRDGADYHAAPAAMRSRTTRWLALTEAPVRSPAARSGLLARWLGWRPLVATLGVAALLAVAIDVAWLQTSRDDQLTDDVVASHVRSMLGAHLVDVASSDHHTVKPFLSARLGFSPPVDELPLPGSSLVGGRVDYLEGRPVAALVYRQGEHIVNSFVWAAKATDSTPRIGSLRGYRTAHWTERGMTHWVVSDVNPAEFDAVVRAIRLTSELP